MGSSPSSSNASASRRSSVFGSTSSRGTSFTSGDLSDQSPLSPKAEDTRSDHPPTVIPMDVAHPQTPYLLTCAPEKKRAPKLAHLPVDYPKDVESDADVAWKLRDHYEKACHMGGGLLGKLRLRGVRGIEFVMVSEIFIFLSISIPFSVPHETDRVIDGRLYSSRSMPIASQTSVRGLMFPLRRQTMAMTLSPVI